MKISTRNILSGEVTLEITGGVHIVSTITSSSAEALMLAEGDKACAAIKASRMMVGAE